MAKISVLNHAGIEVEKIEVNDQVFAREPHRQALFDALTMQRASLRQGTHKTKTRTEVAGGGKKPWKQKGTGRARQGSIRSPQWRGGGIVFGPTPRSYNYRINRKVARLALISALALKFQESKIAVVEDFKFEKPSTKAMTDILKNINVDRKPLIITKEVEENVFYSTRNIAGALNIEVAGMNVLDIVNAHKLVITKSAILTIGEVLSNE